MHKSISTVFWKGLVVTAIVVQLCLLIRMHNWFKNIAIYDQKFVGFHLNSGRLGNQVMLDILTCEILSVSNLGGFSLFSCST